MTAVRRGVDDHVRALRRHAALEHRLESRIVVVVAGKRQVIDEDDELERVGGKLVEHRRDELELVLADLDDAQPLAGELVDNGLHRGRLARARIARQQHVGRGLASQKGARVGQDKAFLALVASKVRQALGVGMRHGAHRAVICQRKHAEASVHAKAEATHLLDAGRVLRHQLDPLGLKAGHEALPVETHAQRRRGEVGDLLQGAQVGAGARLHRGGDVAPSRMGEHVGVLVVAHRVEHIARQAVVAACVQAAHKLAVHRHAGMHGSVAPAVQVAQKPCYNGVGKQPAENPERPQAQGEIREHRGALGKGDRRGGTVS